MLHAVCDTDSLVFVIITNVKVHIKWFPIAISIFIEHILVEGSIQANGWNNACQTFFGVQSIYMLPYKNALVYTKEIEIELIP